MVADQILLEQAFARELPLSHIFRALKTFLRALTPQPAFAIPVGFVPIAHDSERVTGETDPY